MRFVFALVAFGSLLAAACGDNSVVDPCVAMQCPLPAAPTCNGNTLVVTADGVCSDSDGAANCAYATTTTDCAAMGQVCAAGGCHASNDPCVGETCTAPPAAACSGTMLTSYGASGTCDGSSGSAVCDYAPHVTDCAATNQACSNGACVGACVGVTCDTPPAASCSGTELLTYDATGTCDSSTGSAVCTYTKAGVDCALTGKVCDPVQLACVDPCTGVTCSTPPTATCAAGVLTTYASAGSCSGTSGTPSCTYAPTTTDCTAQDKVCDAAAAACDDPCNGFTCTTPPAPSCAVDGFTLTTYGATGTCSSPAGIPGCTYTPSTTDCSASDQACANGACVDPCAGFTCAAPPKASCDADVLTTYAAGVCGAIDGVPSCSYAPTTTDCGAQSLICDAGVAACVSTCGGVTCTTPPASTCSGNTLTSYVNPGTCDTSGADPTCDYAPVMTDCTLSDQICSGGACVSPCTGFICAEPPSPICTGTNNMTAETYAATGTCSLSNGSPTCSYAPTDTNCAAQNLACSNGACTDPCSGITCNTPPSPICTGASGNVVESYGANGTCDSPGGIEGCVYPPTDKDCALSGQTCTGGACTGTVLFVRTQSPSTITDVAGTMQTVYGRIYIQGVTDVSGVDDPIGANVMVQFGTGTGTDPTAYAYVNATQNALYGPSSPGYEPNNDEYMTTFAISGANGSTVSYGYRLSNDGGTTWVYGDLGNPGSSDGFTAPGVIQVAAPYFNEEIEGSSNNKAVEIYNPGSVPFTLTGCQLQVFANGGTTGQSPIALTNATITQIAAGGFLTVCNTSYTAAVSAGQCDFKTSNANWNGNDAFVFSCAGTVYDSFGQVGNDPGVNGWGTGLLATTDHTLLRICSIFAGDTVINDTFDPSVQWAGYAKDTDDLGSRNCPLP